MPRLLSLAIALILIASIGPLAGCSSNDGGCEGDCVCTGTDCQCPGSGDCSIHCGDDCNLACTGSGDCDFDRCSSGQIEDCGDSVTFVCNGACP